MIPPAPPPLVVGPLTRTDLVRYQGASGDLQPVHHDEPFAKSAGYDAPLSLGMLHAGLLGTWSASWLGATRVRRFKVRFTEQAFPGDTLTCTGAVTEQHAEADRPHRFIGRSSTRAGDPGDRDGGVRPKA